MDAGSKGLYCACHCKQHCHQHVCISSPALEFHRGNTGGPRWMPANHPIKGKPLLYVVPQGSMFLSLCCSVTYPLAQEVSRLFSMKGQIVSILGFASHVWSLSHTLLLLPLLLFIYLQSLKNIKSIFRL